jgi:alpha-beta hydrolase superfamily lysophospholipase
MQDYLHVLKYTLSRFPDARIIVYGHSLGGSVAVCLLSKLRDGIGCKDTEDSNYMDGRFANIRGLILENPFSSIPDMTKALYPDRWTPYHYMGPLTWDQWNALGVMRNVRGDRSVLDRLRRDMMVVISENDEVVPKEMGKELWEAGRNGEGLHEDDRDLNGFGSIVVVRNALHENAWMRRQWLKEVSQYLAEVRRRL